MKLTVVIPVFNGAKFLRSSVLSALQECRWDVEVIVVDDGSSDGCLNEVADLKVRVLRLPTNRGPSRARNEGLAAARGEYIAFLDSDDLLSQDSLSWRIAFLEEHPHRFAVSGLIDSLIDGSGEPMEKVNLVSDAASLGETLIDRDFYLAGGSLGQPLGTTMFRKKIFQEIGYFDESLRLAEDIDLYLRAIAFSPVSLVFRSALKYRIHPGNSSRDNCLVPSWKANAAAFLIFQSHGYRHEFRSIPENSFSIYQKSAR